MTPLLSFNNVSFTYGQSPVAHHEVYGARGIDARGGVGAGVGAGARGRVAARDKTGARGGVGERGRAGSRDEAGVCGKSAGASLGLCDGVDDTYALKHINLDIHRGEFVAVLGANGSGKSTFARLCNALLLPSQGDVLIDGVSSAQAQHVFLARRMVGMVFQNPDNQIVASLVEQDVAFGPENLGVKNPELRTRVTQALERVGLAGYEKREVNTLSGGEKQRLALAGVLAMEPQVIVLDEATSMLDPRGRREFLALCKTLHAQGTTLIMITHSAEEAVCAQRALVFHQGYCVVDEPCERAFLRTEFLQDFGVVPPFALELSRELQRCHVPVLDQVHLEPLKEELCSLRLSR